VNAPIEPHKAEFSDIFVWMKETVLLFRRKPIIFSLLSLAFFGLCYLLNINNFVILFIALVMCKLTLVLGIVIARCADESRRITIKLCYLSVTNSIVPLLVLSAIYMLLWLIATLAVLSFGDSIAQPPSPQPIPVLQWLNVGTFALIVVYMGIMISTMWFLIPLVIFYKLGLVDSVKFARQGERKNFMVVYAASYLPFMVFFVMYALSDLSLVMAVAALPLFAIYLYVSFRHVYMGRKESDPVEVKVADALPAQGS